MSELIPGVSPQWMNLDICSVPGMERIRLELRKPTHISKPPFFITTTLPPKVDQREKRYGKIRNAFSPF